MVKMAEAPRNSRTYSETGASNSERRPSYSERQDEEIKAEITF